MQVQKPSELFQLPDFFCGPLCIRFVDLCVTAFQNSLINIDFNGDTTSESGGFDSAQPPGVNQLSFRSCIAVVGGPSTVDCIASPKESFGPDLRTSGLFGLFNYL